MTAPNSEMPRWLELQVEIDYEMWDLERRKAEITAMLSNRSLLDVAIDQATGREAALMDEGRERVARIAALQAEYFDLTSGDSHDQQ